MALPRLIGITGLAGVGKDTLADHLVSTHGYHRYSLAGPIKALLNARFGWTDAQWADRVWKERPALASTFEYGGAAGVADPMYSPRQMAQWLGTEVGRTIGGPDVWLTLMESEWHRLNRRPGTVAARMVVPDVRFDNEARRIYALGGVVIRIIRPGTEPVNAHVSEKGVQDRFVNVEVINDDSVEVLINRAVTALLNTPRGA